MAVGKGVATDMYIAVTHDGVHQVIELSEFNAWRVLGMLAIKLGVALPARVAKQIRM